MKGRWGILKGRWGIWAVSNAANKNSKADVGLETIWEKERKTPKRNVPTNHHETAIQ